MASDSIKNAAVPASNTKDFAKKKRNRSAKLKQCKLDVRREQWLSQVKNKGSKEETDYVRERESARTENTGLLEKNLGMRRTGEENDGSTHHHHDSDSESLPLNSPSSANSIFGSNVSGMNCSSSSSSSSSGGCYSGSITEEEEDNDGCLDDWEAVADALAADDKSQNTSPDPPRDHEPPSHSGPSHGLAASRVEITKLECAKVPRAGQAWRLDDASRPQSLPNLAKQHSFPMNSNRRWAYANIIPAPSSCPICYEDLDRTDSSFLPCLCGFRLCLFCHKRILEEDGRCPGCRKPYENNELLEGEANVNGGSLTFHLARSCSMITRS